MYTDHREQGAIVPIPEEPSAATTRSRREFIRSSSAVALGAGLASNLVVPKFAHGDGDNTATLQIGLVGCGGRGCGAAQNAINADENCQLFALADAFEDRLQELLAERNLTAI